MSKEYLTNKDGKVWVNDRGEKIPKKCPHCGGDVGLFFRGEPVFICKNNEKHYFGTMRFLMRSEV